MVILNLVQLALAAGYSWLNLWAVGYHGAFAVILFSLWGGAYYSCWDLYQAWLYNQSYFVDLFNWAELGSSLLLNLGGSGDVVSLLLVVIMSLGSFVVVGFVYVEMWDDKEGAAFALLLVLFLVFMGVLAISGSLVVFYLGWEGIGLVSLFLINFWSERARGLKASLKVFFINKVGDCLLFIGLCLLMGVAGGGDFLFLGGCALGWGGRGLGGVGGGWALVDVVAPLLVVGGGVKSSQFGFHIWLLEAMEAPLGASALMHSSTLVVAGIVLTYKVGALVELSPWLGAWLVVWGCWTAVFASIVACFQYELKIVLAYSTISSMGFMYMLLGLGACYEMLLYLTIHAFIKIFLFLVIGAVMAHCGGSQDSRWMGGLGVVAPLWWVLYFVGACGLGGLPYFSGYYCKSLLWNHTSGFNACWGGVQTAIIGGTVCTYIYLWRLGVLIFGGARGGHRSIYRVRWPGLLSALSFGALSTLVLLGGGLWVEYLWFYRGAFMAAQYGLLSNSYNFIYSIGGGGWVLLVVAYACFSQLLFYLVFICGGGRLACRSALVALVFYSLCFMGWVL